MSYKARRTILKPKTLQRYSVIAKKTKIIGLFFFKILEVSADKVSVDLDVSQNNKFLDF